MILFQRKQHTDNIKKKEVLIEHSKKILVNAMDRDIEKLDKLNKILGNGIALYVVAAVGKHR